MLVAAARSLMAAKKCTHHQTSYDYYLQPKTYKYPYNVLPFRMSTFYVSSQLTLEHEISCYHIRHVRCPGACIC